MSVADVLGGGVTCTRLYRFKVLCRTQLGSQVGTSPLGEGELFLFEKPAAGPSSLPLWCTSKYWPSRLVRSVVLHSRWLEWFDRVNQGHAAFVFRFDCLV